MLKAIAVTGFLILTSLLAEAQTLKIINGKILNQSDSLPIEYCNIYIQNTAIGTHSNEAGRFEFKFTSGTTDTLVLSSIGYETYKIGIDQLSSADTIFFLKQSTFLLNEVVVSGKFDSAAYIVEQAINRISKNYPTKRYYLDAFYRELVIRDSTYVRLLEAAIGIQDPGYDASNEKMKVRVNEVRRSDDMLVYDNYSWVHEKLYGQQNILLKCLKSDVVRATKVSDEYYKFLSSDFVRNFNFTLRGNYQTNGRKVFVVEYTSVYKGPIQEYGILKIDSENYAFLEIEYCNGIHKESKENDRVEFFYNGEILTRYNIRYVEYDGKYYLNHIQWFVPVGKAWQTNNSQGEKSLQYFQCALYVNNIITAKKEMDKIRARDAEKKEVDLYSKKWTYNKEFWDQYNYVILNPLYTKSIDDLEKNGVPIDEQFKKQ